MLGGFPTSGGDVKPRDERAENHRMIGMGKLVASGMVIVGVIASGALARPAAAVPLTSTLSATRASASQPLALTSLPSTAAHSQYGVLLADPSHAASDYDAGVRLTVVEVLWSDWEPSAGSISSAYRTQEINIVNGFRAQGFTVGVNLSLNHAPAWVLNLPEGQLQDQSGVASGTANYQFSQSVRAATDTYISSVVSSLSGVSYYTIGMSRTSEAVYPASTGVNQWWAFDDSAQGKAANLPGGTPASPLPGWVPGTSSWDGKAVTAAQVQAWYNWYEQALASSVSWEMSTIRAAGFDGWFELQLVGDGANPWVYRNRIAADLAPESYDSYSTLNAGAYYPQLLADIPDLQGVAIDITSVGDESGTAPDNACAPSDASVNYLTNPAVDTWSSTRWLTYLAGQHGLPVMGESTGENSAAQMTHDVVLAKACGLVALQWAFDYQLYGGRYATITDYAKAIAQAASIPAATPSDDCGFTAASVAIASAPDGYFITDAAGQVCARGSATWRGDAAGQHLNAPIIGIEATPDGGGYWLLGADGGIFAYGDAGYYGSTGSLKLNAPAVGMVVTPDNHGYLIIAKDGGVFTFGDAVFHGSTGSLRLNRPIDGIAMAPGGHGYWLVASDGGVFTFTPDGFYGSLGSNHLNKPIVGMSSTPDGRGYTLVGSDGGVFSMGDAHFYGSLGANPPSTPVVDLSPAPGDNGYYLLDSGGGVFAFGPGAHAQGGA